ncbi:hypothetical protein Ocin01_14222, partial [Orchesella cincta]
VSVIGVLYGSFIFNYDGNIPCMTPLHIYALLSCGFGFSCLIYNCIRRKSDPGERCSAEPNESKSRTESTSENCKLDELQGTVIAPLGTSKGGQNANENKWRKLLRCKRECGSNCRSG